MVAFHGFPSYRIAGIPAGSLSYRIAGILPALLLMERWSPDRLSLSFLPATRLPMPPEMVAFHGFPSYRNAGILPAVFLTGSLASCRLFF
jgi:hypothetical protein